MSLKGKKKPQGKLNAKKVLMGILSNKKKKDIAIEAGSIASSDSARINIVNHVINSNEYRQMSMKYTDKLEKHIESLMNKLLSYNLDSVEYKDISTSIERLTKLRELLTGGATERKEVSFDEVKEFLERS
ncbi:hypothetical protein KKA87_06490 [bacterium]|nr:hypothetical protein [bacterium]